MGKNKIGQLSTDQLCPMPALSHGVATRNILLPVAVTYIRVSVPLRIAYQQWIEFEDYPQFMQGIQDVYQKNGTCLCWKAEIDGKEVEWEAEIIAHMPDHCLAWRNRGVINSEEVVTFRPLSDSESSVQLQVAYDPESTVDHVGDLSEKISLRALEDLPRFKVFMEMQHRSIVASRNWI